ncbi:MAG: CsbD family protein [Longispora sp.]|nr:CsbD family protein [Longispora sp. (in: high G+C Gram-positive bacteria)]
MGIESFKDDMVGTAKEKIGAATGNHSLESEGLLQQGKAKLEEATEAAKTKIEEVKERF